MAISSATRAQIVELRRRALLVGEALRKNHDGSGSPAVPDRFGAAEADARITALLAAITAAGGGGGGGDEFQVLTVDERGWPSSYRSGGVTYVIRTGAFGISSVTASTGRVDTYTYSADGTLTAITTTGAASSVPSAITRDGAGKLTSFSINGVTHTL